jgi:hypothetical protein
MRVPDLLTLLRETLVEIELIERLPDNDPALSEFKRQVVLAIAEISLQGIDNRVA